MLEKIKSEEDVKKLSSEEKKTISRRNKKIHIRNSI